jgi:hypothetical protein
MMWTARTPDHRTDPARISTRTVAAVAAAKPKKPARWRGEAYPYPARTRPGASVPARRSTMTNPADRHSDCSKECHYVFYECEADSKSGTECRAAFDQCVAECEVD